MENAFVDIYFHIYMKIKMKTKICEVLNMKTDV